MKEKPNCKNCPYRLALIRIADIHIGADDCDKYGTEFCRNENKKQS